MIVVAVIGILAAIAVPKFSELVRKSKEGQTKGNLGRLRSAINIYYGNNEGWYPSDYWNSNSSVLSSSLTPNYIDKIPPYNPANYHSSVNTVFSHQANSTGHSHDGGGWGYDGVYVDPSYGQDSQWGAIWVFCTHTDAKGTNWSAY